MLEPALEQLLGQYRPAGPDAALRSKILRVESPKWPLRIFRSAIAASLLFSFLLLHAATNLDRSTAAELGPGPIRWTPEAQQMADLIAPGPVGRNYIALCLWADAQTPGYSLNEFARMP